MASSEARYAGVSGEDVGPEGLRKSFQLSQALPVQVRIGREVVGSSAACLGIPVEPAIGQIVGTHEYLGAVGPLQDVYLGMEGDAAQLVFHNGHGHGPTGNLLENLLAGASEVDPEHDASVAACFPNGSDQWLHPQYRRQGCERRYQYELDGCSPQLDALADDVADAPIWLRNELGVQVSALDATFFAIVCLS